MEIVLLHGAGGHRWNMLPIKYFLSGKGYTCHNISYEHNGSLEQCIESVSRQLAHTIRLFETPLIIIGQSLGGLIGSQLHKHGWNIQQLIAIASPLHGARFIGEVEQKVKRCLNNTAEKLLRKLLMREVYYDLRDRAQGVGELSEPPHNYHTISTAWGNSDFDGCVYRDETIITPENHTHIPWSDHRVILLSCRLLSVIHKVVKPLTRPD
jgi:pimeloyl-ACP methyl ester carboxylesterase